MNARDKLNVIFVFSGLFLAILFGLLSQSWLVFLGVLAIGIFLAAQTGMVR